MFIVMRLIDFEDYKIVVTPEAMLIKPIRELYRKDKTRVKDFFYQQMSYLYFMVDPRSTYMYITDPQERAKEIIAQEGLPAKFKPSDELKQAMEIYKKHTTTSSTLLLEDTRFMVDQIRKEMRATDLSQLEEKDKILALKNMVSMGSMVPKLVKDLSDAERAVTQELNEMGRVRGGGEKTIFEDGFDD